MNISKEQLLEMLENIEPKTTRGKMIKAIIMDETLDSYADVFSMQNILQQLFEEFEHAE